MFQRSQQEQYQRLLDRQINTMFQLIEPLKKYWPELVALLKINIECNNNPTHLGEIIAEEFKTRMDLLAKEKQKQIDEQSHTRWDRERELGKKIDQISKEKEKYQLVIQTLNEKNQEQAKQIRIQNTLLADLHRQISNLTGVEDSSTT